MIEFGLQLVNLGRLLLDHGLGVDVGPLNDLLTHALVVLLRLFLLVLFELELDRQRRWRVSLSFLAAKVDSIELDVADVDAFGLHAGNLAAHVLVQLPLLDQVVERQLVPLLLAVAQLN